MPTPEDDPTAVRESENFRTWDRERLVAGIENERANSTELARMLVDLNDEIVRKDQALSEIAETQHPVAAIMRLRARRALAPAPPLERMDCTCGLARCGMAYGPMSDCPEHRRG